MALTLTGALSTGQAPPHPLLICILRQLEIRFSFSKGVAQYLQQQKQQ